MWAQLITARLMPGANLMDVADLLKDFEQPGSGLVREILMQDQKDPSVGYILTVFESEEKARERERDPRRAAGQQAMNELMATMLAGPPEFVDMKVAGEWVP